MAISLQQVLRQSQQLIMTPQMQQSIQLLQMNTLELEQLAQQELLENPFLQTDDEREDQEGYAEAGGGPVAGEDFLSPVEQSVAAMDPEPAAPKSADMMERPSESLPPSEAEFNGPADAETASMEDHPEKFEEMDLNWDDYYYDAENAAYNGEPDEEERDFSEYTPARISLYENLQWQLRMCVLRGRDLEIGEYLIGCIDEDGYLAPGCVDEAALKFQTDPATVERVLSIIQEFDPLGIAARSPAECLLLQMKGLGSYSELARDVIENHFEDLQRKKFKVIAKAVNAPEEEIVALHQKVARLEPKPGRAHSKDSSHYIEPDVYVKIIDGKLTIFVNEGASGRLSVNRFYRRMMRLRAASVTKEEKAYATEKFRDALMLIKNIEKRKSTILRVTESIMDVQREFLERGVEALRPLTLREIAEMVGMHESTVARVTSKKYVETPQGVFPLKFFFSSGIESSDGVGEAVSSRAIKDKIADLISNEGPRAPLSDQKIAEILNQQGHQIARRTVAKYREQLKILPAKLRKATS